MTDSEILDKFGELLVEGVRDSVLAKFDKDQLVNPPDASGQEVYRLAQTKSEEAKEYAKIFAPYLIDTTIEYVLFLMEEHKTRNKIFLCYEVEGELVKLDNLSDGLMGEYLDWVPQFSQEREGLLSEKINAAYKKIYEENDIE